MSIDGSLKTGLQGILSPTQIDIAKRWRRNLQAWRHQGDLVALAKLFGTDKWGVHWYAQHYNRHFGSLRKRQMIVLEVGVGGYDDPNAGGESLRAWKWYFPRAQIVGIDIHPKSGLEERRVRIFQGSQADEAFLKDVIAKVGRPDIVIDDGSHRNDHVLATFNVLFPLLADNGIYVVEDTQTSYWPSFGGFTEERNRATSIMGYFKGLVDGLNCCEYLVPGYEATYYDQHVIAMHFYHNLIFLYKGINNEASNCVREGRMPDWISA